MTDERRLEQKLEHLEEEKEQAARFSLLERAVIAVLALLIVAMLYVLGQLLIPYRPVSVYELKAIPAKVCEGESVGIVADWEVRAPVRLLEVRYGWSRPDEVAGDVEAQSFGGRAELTNIKPFARKEVRSPIDRRTPTEPGVWRLVSEYRVYGHRWGLPLRQDLRQVSEDFLTVRRDTSKQCEGR